MGFDKETIKTIIPHREPMLFVDEVTEMEPGVSIEAKFCVPTDWDIFRGHFPGDPVLPGVFTVEILTQTADILLLSFEKYIGKTPYFIGIDDVKFRKKILPGDTIVMKANIYKENEEKSVVTCDATAYVDGELSTTGKVTLAMR